MNSFGGPSSLCRVETAGGIFLLAAKLPLTWQARIRSSIMTGVFEASESSKPRSTISVIVARFGRGSSSHISDLSAKAWLRSCATTPPSP
jgi:hypothetical protein